MSREHLKQLMPVAGAILHVLHVVQMCYMTWCNLSGHDLETPLQAKKRAERAARRLLVSVGPGLERLSKRFQHFGRVTGWFRQLFLTPSGTPGWNSQHRWSPCWNNSRAAPKQWWKFDNMPLLWQGRAEKEKADKAWTVARLDWLIFVHQDVSRYFNRDIGRKGDFSNVGEFQQNVFCYSIFVPFYNILYHFKSQ